MKSTPPEVYQALAKERGMTIVGPIPQVITEKLIWQCNTCGRTYPRSLKVMRHIPTCRCHGKNAIPGQLYTALAEALGITWLDPAPPRRTRDLAHWRGCDNQLFEAPFAELSRPSIPIRYRPHITPDYEPPPSNYVDVPHTLALKRIKKELG